MLTWVREDELENYPGLYPIESFDNEEDIATLLETYRNVIKEVDYKNILGVKGNIEGYYIFIVGDYNAGFDISQYIQDKNKFGLEFSSIVAGLKFPERISRGLYNPENIYGEEDDDEPPTSFLDEDEDDEKEGFVLIQLRTGQRVGIPDTGIIIGRSSKKSTFVVRENPKVGRAHCSLFFKSGELMVHDFESLNGTYLNGTRVKEDLHINRGDILTLANEEFEIA